MEIEAEHGRFDGCDVVVVGAGIVGAAIAARLVYEGIDTAILEAQTVASGATGRCAGMALTGLAGHYKWAVDAYGRQKAREIWDLTIEGRMRLVEAAVRMKVPVAHTGSLTLASTDEEAEVLEESATLLREDGFDGRFSSDDPLERGFSAALHYPDDVTVDAAALTQALLALNNITVHERTEVYNLEPDQDGVRVWAQGRTVHCRTAVLAINGYAPLLDPYFADKVTPTRGLVFVTPSLDQTLMEQSCCANYGYQYCRQLPDRRLLLSSWNSKRSPQSEAGPGMGQNQVEAACMETVPDDEARDELVRFASRYFPEAAIDDARRWSGLMGFTPDGLPLIGRLPDLPQAHFAVGFGGRGLCWAFIVAERLAQLILHDSDQGTGILTGETEI
jgi:glycine/D-amino acid oxidase-like deaminating enzyme